MADECAQAEKADHGYTKESDRNGEEPPGGRRQLPGDVQEDEVAEKHDKAQDNYPQQTAFALAPATQHIDMLPRARRLPEQGG